MQPLLALLDSVLADLADEATIARVLDRAAERRKVLGSAAGTVARAEALVMAFSDVTRKSPTEAYRLIAEHAMIPLAQRMIKTMQKHSTAHTLCLNVNALIDDELQPLAPTVEFPVVDVEMVDATALRVSMIASPETVALAQGMLSGLAQHYGQLARFTVVPTSRVGANGQAAGRRHFDVVFLQDERARGSDRRVESRASR